MQKREGQDEDVEDQEEDKAEVEEGVEEEEQEEHPDLLACRSYRHIHGIN